MKVTMALVTKPWADRPGPWVAGATVEFPDGQTVEIRCGHPLEKDKARAALRLRLGWLLQEAFRRGEPIEVTGNDIEAAHARAHLTPLVDPPPARLPYLDP